MYSLYPSPVGPLLLASCGGALTLCDWAARHPAAAPVPPDAVCQRAMRELDEYFAGRRQRFTVGVELGGTPLQRAVWEALQEIPYGATATYSQVAARVGRPTAVRAVAHAIGQNPLSILVPCHRVVGTDGRLHGYAGGLAAKRYLLQLEQHI